MKTYCIQTFGCQMNGSDSERIAGFLENNGFCPKTKPETADLVIFNTCGVRQTAEDRALGLIHNLRKKNKTAKIILTGCLAHRADVQKKLAKKNVIFLPTKNIPRLFEIIEKAPALSCSFPEDKDLIHDYLSLPAQYKYPDKSIFLPIMTGCNNFCTYCVVPYARGREWSRPAEEIFQEVQNAIEQGVKKVLLLGQNVNSYRYTKENDQTSDVITFPILLNTLAKEFPQINFEFLTSHPKDFSDELIRVIKQNSNLSKNIHLPLQAGSDRILLAMNRKYTKKHYLKIIDKIRKSLPEAQISTDIIVGFPGETQEDFQETIDVFKKVLFNEAYLNKYSPRFGTVAYKLENDVPWTEKKRREKILKDILQKQKESPVPLPN